MMSKPSELVLIDTMDIPPVPLQYEGSWGARSIGSRASVMRFYCYEDEARYRSGYLIEWEIAGDEEGEAFDVEHIGLWFDGKRLRDYDGLMGYLPMQAVKLIRKNGFVVPHEFYRDTP